MTGDRVFRFTIQTRFISNPVGFVHERKVSAPSEQVARRIALQREQAAHRGLPSPWWESTILEAKEA